MGTGETGTPMKTSKVLPTQEQQTTPTSYPEWAAAFQAYYNSGGQPPPGYFPPSAASGPQPHPYMWGGQPMMPPYGAPPPPPYGAMYTHGGIMYSHPSMPPGGHTYSQFGMATPAGGASEAAMIAATGAEVDGLRGSDNVKDRKLLKMSRGSLGSVGIATNKGVSGKGNNGSANGVLSQSSEESGTDGSTEGSEEESSQNMLRKKGVNQMPADDGRIMDGAGPASSNPQTDEGSLLTPGTGVALDHPLSGSHSSISGKLTDLSGPTTNLGIGIQDYWSGSNPGAVPIGKGEKKRTSVSTSGAMDEREVKRQRRKQSNRESARRSRLRKQAECEELGTRVDALTVENIALRTELARVTEECKKLTSDHSSLLEQLQKYQVEDTVLAPEQGGDNEHEALTMQPDGNGKVVQVGCNISSAGKQVNMREEESSQSSPSKTPSELDSGARS